MVGNLLYALGGLAGVVALICWILVLIRMFQAGHTTPGLVALLLLLCGLSPIFVLIYGWMKVDELGIRQLMTIYSVAFVIAFLSGSCGGVMNAQIGF